MPRNNFEAACTDYKKANKQVCIRKNCITTLRFASSSVVNIVCDINQNSGHVHASDGGFK